jgi:hypothetical protein
MKDTIIENLMGLNGLVSLANIVFLVALCFRSVLLLRALTVVSSFIILPYYYFQPVTLWPPIFWSVAFIVANGVGIVVLALQRRPVVLSDREEELYRLAFRTIDRRDFLRLVSLARWVDFSSDQLVVKKGQVIAEAMIVISGKAQATLDGKLLAVFGPGQLIGEGTAYSGLASPADVVATGPVRLVVWELEQVRKFIDSRPALRAQLLQIENRDLADKLRSLVGIEVPQLEGGAAMDQRAP